MTRDIDKRPPPKPRKHPVLWQSYLWWREMNELRKRHLLRIASIKAGKSNMDLEFEHHILNLWPYADAVDEDGNRVWSVEETAKRMMIEAGQQVGPIWDWLVGIRGIGDASAAKLLAQFDNVENFAYASRFRRFAGWGMYEYWQDGRGNIVAPKDGYQAMEVKKGREYLCPRCNTSKLIDANKRLECPTAGCNYYAYDGNKIPVYVVTDPKPGWELVRSIDRKLEGWVCPFNTLLKSEVWVVVDNFIKQRTPIYRTKYDEERERLRRRYPERIKQNGRTMHNDGHHLARAKRKVAGLFLCHLWAKWREFDGLPVTEPWILREGGHVTYIAPPEVVAVMA